MSPQRPIRFATNTKTAAYLGVSTMTLSRWKRDLARNFPEPSVVGQGNELNDLDKIDAWMESNRLSRVKSRETEAA